MHQPQQRVTSGSGRTFDHHLHTVGLMIDLHGINPILTGLHPREAYGQELYGGWLVSTMTRYIPCSFRTFRGLCTVNRRFRLHVGPMYHASWVGWTIDVRILSEEDCGSLHNALLLGEGDDDPERHRMRTTVGLEVAFQHEEAPTTTLAPPNAFVLGEIFESLEEECEAERSGTDREMLNMISARFRGRELLGALPFVIPQLQPLGMRQWCAAKDLKFDFAVRFFNPSAIIGILWPTFLNVFDLSRTVLDFSSLGFIVEIPSHFPWGSNEFRKDRTAASSDSLPFHRLVARPHPQQPTPSSLATTITVTTRALKGQKRTYIPIRGLALPLSLVSIGDMFCVSAFFSDYTLDLRHLRHLRFIGKFFCRSARLGAFYPPHHVTDIGPYFLSDCTVDSPLNLESMMDLREFHDFTMQHATMSEVIVGPAALRALGKGFMYGATIVGNSSLDLRQLVAVEDVHDDFLHGLTVMHGTVLLPPRLVSIGSNFMRNVKVNDTMRGKPSNGAGSGPCGRLDLRSLVNLRRIGASAFCGIFCHEISFPCNLDGIGPSFLNGIGKGSNLALDLSKCRKLKVLPPSFVVKHSFLEQLSLPASITSIGELFLASSHIHCPLDLCHATPQLKDIGKNFLRSAVLDGRLTLPPSVCTLGSSFMSDSNMCDGVGMVDLSSLTAVEELAQDFMLGATHVQRVCLPPNVLSISSGCMKQMSMQDTLDLRHLTKLESIGFEFLAQAQLFGGVRLPTCRTLRVIKAHFMYYCSIGGPSLTDTLLSTDRQFPTHSVLRLTLEHAERNVSRGSSFSVSSDPTPVLDLNGMLHSTLEEVGIGFLAGLRCPFEVTANFSCCTKLKATWSEMGRGSNCVVVVIPPKSLSDLEQKETPS